jgi:DNA-directed RNA polymerase beta subunit
METVTYGRYQSVAEIPDLVEMQTEAYEAFLQPDVLPNKREEPGLEALLREIFPIQSYDKTLSLEYIHYELGRPSYTPDECRKLRKTFGYPFKIRVRLVKPEPVEEEIYLGEIPIMIGGGEFIINGSERVTVSQLHRSPGRRLLGRTAHRREEAALVLGDPGARQLDRAQRHQEGDGRGPHRPDRASSRRRPCCARSTRT